MLGGNVGEVMILQGSKVGTEVRGCFGKELREGKDEERGWEEDSDREGSCRNACHRSASKWGNNVQLLVRPMMEPVRVATPMYSTPGVRGSSFDRSDLIRAVTSFTEL